MSQPIIPQLDMLSVLLDIEKRQIPPLDDTLLGTVAGACQTIGSQILTALEGKQRDVFQELCAYITKENIEILPVSDPTWPLIIKLIGLGIVSHLVVTTVWRYRRRIGIPFRLVARVWRKRRRIGIPFQPVSRVWRNRRRIGIPCRLALVQALCTRIQHTKMLLAPSSTASQLPMAKNGEDVESNIPLYPSLQLSPAFAPDYFYGTMPSTESEGLRQIATDSNNPPFKAKRKASPEDDEESKESLPPSKRLKGGLPLSDSRQIDNETDLAEAAGSFDIINSPGDMIEDRNSNSD